MSAAFSFRGDNNFLLTVKKAQVEELKEKCRFCCDGDMIRSQCTGMLVCTKCGKSALLFC